MSGREWKPGDVARSEHAGISVVVAKCDRHFAQDLHWHHEGGGWDYLDDVLSMGKFRPLVVIDPEDREQVERLWDQVALQARANPIGGGSLDDLQAALREFANPAPPKPQEPQGLGAVVEDSSGVWWVRVNVRTGTQEWRSCDYYGEFRKWAAINVIRVLSEGVQAGESA